MTSYAVPLGLDVAALQAAIVSRFAYATGRSQLGFPKSDFAEGDPEIAASLPTSASQWVVDAEAGTVLRGAACASLVVDQLLALKLLAESAFAYERAGFLYGLFLQATLGIPQVRRLEKAADIASVVLEGGLAATRQQHPHYADSLANPVQLSYLVLAVALGERPDLARRLLNAPWFPAGTVEVGGMGILNADLFTLVLGERFVARGAEQSTSREVLADILRRLDAQVRWRTSAPAWRQRLPWNDGIDCDVVLVLLTLDPMTWSDLPGVPRARALAVDAGRRPASCAAFAANPRC